MGSFDEQRDRLTQRLAALERRTEQVEGDLQRPRDSDSQEAAQQAENDEVLEGLDAQGRDEIAQIRSALERIERGTYGTCARCGEAIARGRLEALPYTSLCIDCAD